MSGSFLEPTDHKNAPVLYLAISCKPADHKNAPILWTTAPQADGSIKLLVSEDKIVW